MRKMQPDSEDVLSTLLRIYLRSDRTQGGIFLATRAAFLNALKDNLLDFYLALHPSSPRIALPVYQAEAVDARRANIEAE
jgi:hypothetical protein